MIQRTISTDRLTLVPMSDEHIEFEVRLDANAEVMRFLGEGLPRDRQTVEGHHRQRVNEARVHVDIKKQGRIPDGGGHRMNGRLVGRRHKGDKGGRGYSFIHHAVDDRSRLAYSEILGDEKKETAAGFWHRANAFFASHGITVLRVITDNGACYRSKAFDEALGAGTAHKFTRPYRPQTNGKVERFNRTLEAEWAYATAYDSDEARAATYQQWVHDYNHHRPHCGIGNKPPITRVHNVSGSYS